jgi:uncharacterized protein (TIGR02284 family)
MPQSTEHHPATEWVSALIDACRETQFAFEVSAGGIQNRLLRAELLQYSGQRREFIAELISTARKYGDDVIDPGNIRDPLARQCKSQKSAIQHRDLTAILSECERSEMGAIASYRAAFAMDLPAAVHAMVATHLSAITRVHERIHRLRLNAQSDRN